MVQSRVHEEGTKEYEALKKVVERFDIAKNADREIKDKHLEFYKLYRNQDQKREGRSNIFVPMIYALIETIVPRMLKGLFEKRPYVSVLPRNFQSQPAAEANEKLLDYQFCHTHLRLLEKCEDWVKQFLMYGVGVVQTYWDLEEKTLVRKTSVAKNNVTGDKHIIENIESEGLLRQVQEAPEWELTREEIEEDVTMYEGPNFDVVDIGDLHVAPNAKDIKTAEYLVYRYPLTMEDLEKGQDEERYKNINKLKKARVTETSGAGTDMEMRVDRRKEEMDYTTGAERRDRHREQVEILEYWENGEKIIVADRDVVISGPEENPYWHQMKPFISVHNTRLLGEFWSVGEIEPNLSLQKEINTRRNQRIDNINLSLTKAWFVLNNVTIDKGSLSNILPGQMIRVKGVNRIEDGIQEFNVSDITSSSYQEESVAKDDMRTTSGIYDWYSGKQPTQQQTATTVTAIIGEAHVRVEMKIYKFAIQGIAELAQHFIQLNQQFLDDSQMVRIVGEKGVDFHAVQPEEIAGFFDMQPAATGVDPLANKELKQQQALQLYQMMIQNPIINQYKLASLVLEQFEEVDRPEEYLLEQPAMPPGAEGEQPQGSPQQPG